MVRSTSGSKAASSTLSNKARAKPPAPHYLGGSNNLVGERHRRQVAETTLQDTKLSLRTVTHELVPQVEELAKAIKTIQIEKHQQLDLDEAAQEILEDIQQQLNAIETQQNNFPRAVEDRLDQLMQQISEQATGDKYLTASHEFLTKRMNAVDDAVDCVRKEVARAGELQYEAKQSLNKRVSELDEKLFGFDKELLKIKLALPSAIAAQMPTAFSDQVSSRKLAELPLGGMALQQKLQEISQDIVSLKADAVVYRAADRKQFDGFTNRLRESLKSHQSMKKELDTRLQQMQLCYDQVGSHEVL
uniref:Uncharacterized protein n=1 Tax=Globisporangium ultimum (strain ATCC 200006 / CBS 805.95 / DAOM BR144) TaxID=431595 RepID=K3X4T8_GLOUD